MVNIPDSEVIGLVILHFVFEHLVDILIVLFELSPRLSKFGILVHYDFGSVFVGVKGFLLDITISHMISGFVQVFKIEIPPFSAITKEPPHLRQSLDQSA